MPTKEPSVRELLDILDTYTRGSGEGTQLRQAAGAKLRALSEEEKEAVGCTFVNEIVEDLAAFLEVDKKDAEGRSLWQTIDTNVVVMNGKQASSPCTAYMQALDYHVQEKDGYRSGSLVFALDKWDGLTKKMKPDYEKKVCDVLKRLLRNNRDKIEAWTNALKAGFVMPALGGNRKAFPIVSEKVEAIWELIEDFEDLWKSS